MAKFIFGATLSFTLMLNASLATFMDRTAENYLTGSYLKHCRDVLETSAPALIEDIITNADIMEMDALDKIEKAAAAELTKNKSPDSKQKKLKKGETNKANALAEIIPILAMNKFFLGEYSRQKAAELFTEYVIELANMMSPLMRFQKIHEEVFGFNIDKELQSGEIDFQVLKMEIILSSLILNPKEGVRLEKIWEFEKAFEMKEEARNKLWNPPLLILQGKFAATQWFKTLKNLEHSIDSFLKERNPNAVKIALEKFLGTQYAARSYLTLATESQYRDNFSDFRNTLRLRSLAFKESFQRELGTKPEETYKVLHARGISAVRQALKILNEQNFISKNNFDLGLN